MIESGFSVSAVHAILAINENIRPGDDERDLAVSLLRTSAYHAALDYPNALRLRNLLPGLRTATTFGAVVRLIVGHLCEQLSNQ